MKTILLLPPRTLLRRIVAACFTLIASCAAPAADTQVPGDVQTRCGWLENPTPGNFWLQDRDGEWTLSLQGGYKAPGFDGMPDMSTKGQVTTNGGNHGYSCACMSVTVDPASGNVTRLVSARPLPLQRCRADHKLPKPE